MGVLRRAVTGVSRVLTGDVPRLASGVAREAGWSAAHLISYPLGLLAEPTRRGPGRHDLGGLSPRQRGLMHVDVDTAARPILLVHGIVDNHTIFTRLDRALRRRGFTELSWFDYGLLTSDLRTVAADLAEEISALCGRSGYEQVHVIGHSLGGLIARYYVQRMGGHARVKTLVTLGTPHQGTVLARAGQLLPLVRQLRPESEIIRELTQPAPGCSTRFLSFYSDLDHLVVPSRHGRIDHPDLDVRNVAVTGIGHLTLPNSSRVAGDIAEMLQQLDPAGSASG